MPTARYRYELRRDEQIVATGHITYEPPLQIDDRISIGSEEGIVSEIGPMLAGGELRLIVRLEVSAS